MDRMKWTINNGLNAIQSMLLVASIAGVLGLTAWLLGDLSLALMAVGTTLFLYVVNPYLSPRLAMRLWRARHLTVHEAPRLWSILEELAGRAGLERLPALYHVPSGSMNAFAAGTRHNAAVAVSTGLLRHLSPVEVAAVVAHEVSHIRNNDTRIMRFADTAADLTHMLSVLGQILFIVNLPMLLVAEQMVSWAGVWLLLMAPHASGMLRLWLSRTREYRADLGASALLGRPEPLAAALSKIEAHHRHAVWRLPWFRPRPLPETEWLRTHPPTAERIRRLMEMRTQPLAGPAAVPSSPTAARTAPNRMGRPHARRFPSPGWSADRFYAR